MYLVSCATTNPPPPVHYVVTSQYYIDYVVLSSTMKEMINMSNGSDHKEEHTFY